MTGSLVAPRDDATSATDLEIPYEGDTSFTALSKRMAETLDVAFQNSPQAFDNGQLSAATSRMQRLLREVASIQAPVPAPSPASNSFSQYSDLSSLQLLPVGIVLKMLKLAKGSILL